MSNVLFVKANDRPADQAVSVQLYDAFVNSYRSTHPDASITELDLFAADLPYLDSTMITGLFKEAKGFDQTPEEQKAADTANAYLNQFLAADTIVFAFPLWNFTIPAQLVTYLHYLSQAGKTFSYTPQGPVGLLGGKKVVLLNASGGVYSEGPTAPLEMSLNYVRNMMSFFGVKDQHIVRIEGHNQFADRAEEIKQAGFQQAAALAASL